jgi:hypothetical protein
VRNCRLSGFEGAQAPTGNYAFDVHINSGLAHLGNEVSIMIEDISQLWWTALVAMVRGVIVVLDWCFTIDLLNSSAMSGVGQGLRATQATFTQPWLVIVLAIASVLALYNGLIRRRVAETLGEALLMMAMMVGGLWVIMNPLGTVGALGAWANEASLGTLGAAMAGSPDHPDRTLAQTNQELFSAAINNPWCYLEFGDVSWCNARPSSQLQAAALSIAGDSHHAPGRSATLLRGARTNGEVFLALPANGPARNSINTEWSLFRVLCGSGEEPCRGPTAGQAEFRTQSGTWARAIGLVLISFGLLGMLLLLGFIALRLLHAALASLIYLMLTPAAVLAPALGESGRTAFRMWVMRLLGAITSKLLFSFLLGAVLMVERVLSSIHVFGWLTQWLLISSLWWIVFINRHKVFELTHGERGHGRQHRSIVGRAGDVLESRKGMATARWAKRRLSQPGPSVERRRSLARAGAERAKEIADEQVARGLGQEHGEAQELVDAGEGPQARISGKRARLDRMRAEHADALSKAAEAKSAREEGLTDFNLFTSPLERDRAAAKHGAEELRQRERAVKLQTRMDHLQGEIDRDQSRLTAARQTVKDGELAMRTTGKPYTRARVEEYGQHLDAQAALPRGQRDYAGMAGVVGMTRGQFEALGQHEQLKGRLGIDRELDKRKELSGAVADMTASAAAGSVGRSDKRKGSVELERKLGERLRGSPRRSGASGGSSRLDAGKHEGATTASSRTRQRSSPVDDAREVARRKRQMGRDRQ